MFGAPRPERWRMSGGQNPSRSLRVTRDGFRSPLVDPCPSLSAAVIGVVGEEVGKNKQWLRCDQGSLVVGGCLNRAIGHYGASVRTAETGTGDPSGLSREQEIALIPRFAAAGADLIERALIEIREPFGSGWDDAPQLSPDEITAVLADRYTWVQAEPDLPSLDTDRRTRMVADVGELYGR